MMPLAKTNSSNHVQVWSMVHGVCLRLMQGRHEDMTWPCVMALSPDGSLLATGSTGPFGGSTIKLFCAQTQPVADPGACLATLAHLLHDQKGDISALEFSGNGCVLFSGASDGTVAAWSIERGDAPAVVSCTGLCRGFL
jgi:WD40 repeat protein